MLILLNMTIYFQFCIRWILYEFLEEKDARAFNPDFFYHSHSISSKSHNYHRTKLETKKKKSHDQNKNIYIKKKKNRKICERIRNPE